MATTRSTLIAGLLPLLVAVPVGAQSPPRSPASRPSSAPASAPTSRPTEAPASRPAPAADPDLAELEAALAADGRSRSDGDDADRDPRGGWVQTAVRTFQSLNPEISFIADVALAWFTSEDPLMSGAHDPRETGFTLQQLELAVSAAVDPYFRFNANVVFSEFGVEIEEVYATTLSLPWNLQLRAGQFLTRFGRINNTHPHTWKFVDQPLVMGKFFGGENNRGVGVEASVLLPLPWYVLLLGSATDAAGASTTRSFFGSDDLGVEDPGDFQYTVAAKQFFPLGDDLSLAWGLSAALGPNSTGRDNRSEIFATDLYLKYRPISRGSYTVVSLELEWMLRRRQVPADVLQDHGMYTQLFYRFTRRWAAAARYEYVSGTAADYLDPLWTGTRHRASGNITFWPTEFSRLRLQYNHDRPSWRDGYHGVMTSFEFAVGAHGAHTF